MADTRQVLKWTLERKCPFRSGRAAKEIHATFEATAALRTHSDLPTSAIDGDLCVTSWIYSKAGTKPNGYRISEVFSPFGGLAAARATCGGCDANIWSERSEKMGGCAGVVAIDPDSPELESSLSQVVAASSLDDGVGSAFVPTSPIWYGLWVNSPLSQNQCRLLLKVLSGIELLTSRDRRILPALESALAHALPLHVDLTALGHTDFGVYTEFPHCPRCKAFAGFTWQTPYPRDPMTCRVCGGLFIPADTFSSRKMSFPTEPAVSAVFTELEVREILKSMPPPPHPMAGFLRDARRKAEE
jgi:hypothetical protein